MWPGTRRDTAFLVVAALLVLAAVMVTALTGVPYLAAVARENGLLYDFGIFYRSAAALRGGAPVYPPGQPNFSPPAAVAAFVPLTLLSPLAAYRVFAALSLVAVLAAVVAVARVARASTPQVALAVAALVISPALAVTLAQGQVYAVLAAGLALAWVLGRRERPMPAGFVLGLVVAAKPLLAPVLLWPLACGRRREALVGLVTTGVVSVAGMLVVGPSQVVDYLAVLRAGFPRFDSDNASLTTTGLRLVTPGREVAPLVDVPGLSWVGGVVAIGLLAWTLARRADTELGLWAIVAACLLVSPIAWRGYLLLLLPGAVAMLGRDQVRALGILLLAVLVLPHRTPALFTPGSPAYVLTTLVGPASLLVLWAGLAGAARAEATESLSPSAAGRGTGSPG